MLKISNFNKKSRRFKNIYYKISIYKAIDKLSIMRYNIY